MSFTANNDLQFTNTPDSNGQTKILKDWQHGARMFSDQQFRLAPKLDFQHHVSFNINTAALKNTAIFSTYGNELNMLAKSVTLPKFEIKVEDVNQYNRHKQIQTRHVPGDVTIKFYDDNMGLVNQMWQNYYAYYYADPISANTAGSYDRTATKSSNYINHPYGLDNGSTNPFFNYILISQMARHEFVSVKLINPIIKSWDGMGLDWSKTTVHEFTMVISYEAVSYNQGVVATGAPEGFGVVHYDTTPSTLTGINPDPSVIDPSFVQALDMESLAPGILNNTINTINNYQNTQSTAGSSSSALGTALGVGALALGAAGGLGLLNGLSGAAGALSGFSFPGSSSASDLTNATESGIGNMDSASLAPTGDNSDTAIPSGDGGIGPAVGDESDAEGSDGGDGTDENSDIPSTLTPADDGGEDFSQGP
jgi:hypothetical protein